MIHDVYMQVFFTCDQGFEERTAQVQDKVCRSRLLDLYYEMWLQCIVNHAADVDGEVVRKPDARTR
jgi:hypothetical protein